MEILQYILLIVFVVCMIVGYYLINNVPSLLHTPLMSGMNALSGVTVLGALSVYAYVTSNDILTYIFGSFAIVLAMINVVGGFAVTNRMLRMFVKKEKNNE